MKIGDNFSIVKNVDDSESPVAPENIYSWYEKKRFLRRNFFEQFPW